LAGKVDFRRVADAALGAAERLVPQWLPQGRREGHEWKALNPKRADSRLGSFSVNLNSGAWADFATGDKGGDLISLLAYLDDLTQLDAARVLAQELAVSLDETQPASAPVKPRSEWTPIVPAPADAPSPPVVHVKRGHPEASWAYRNAGGELLGVIYRFRTSDGGKEVLPCVYATHAASGAREWRWLAFPTPRSLYGLPALDQRPVVLVEGEKCVDALRGALGADAPVSVLTWPGGSKAVDKADWSVLHGRQVVIWPDCDAQTDKVDALLPEAQQPGVRAAERIAEILHGHAKVRIVVIPAPGAKPGGWDCADAIAEGMQREELLAFMRNLREPLCGKSASTPEGARATGDDSAWRRALVYAGKGLKDCRENVIYLLRDHPAWRGVVGADAFAKRIVTRKPSPIGHTTGAEWSQDDDVRLGLWLAEQEGLLVRSLDTIRGAVQHVAALSKFHPVREFLELIEWDGVHRVDEWAVHFLGAADTPYHRLVGRFFLINLVRRVYEPGCIMRSLPVLEGAQDRGKSTALRLLAQPWFSDTPFKVGDKDSYQQIQGVMVYEISELESFTRAEATAVKAFVSSTEDNFRAPYERQNEKHKRQTVFAATTNAVEYLKDWTGNTRFWPLACGQRIDLDGIGNGREQLLAEALALYRRREPTYPTHEQQAELFAPEQERRMLSHPWQDIIVEKLDYDADWKYRDTVTVREVMDKVLRMDLSRVNAQGGEAQRVGQILHALGWKKRRLLEGGARAWTWARPEKPKQPVSADADDIPF
jgi:putative DNA primase/helicase